MNRPPSPTNHPFLLLIAIGLLAYLGATTTSALYKSYQNKDRLQSLQQNVDHLKIERKQLQNQLEYQKSEEFIEEEARNKLSLARPNETVVIFPQDQVLAAQTGQRVQNQAKPPTRQASNFGPWVDFFFN